MDMSKEELDMWTAKYKLWKVLNFNKHDFIGKCSPCPLQGVDWENCPKKTIQVISNGEELVFQKWPAGHIGADGLWCVEWIKHV